MRLILLAVIAALFVFFIISTRKRGQNGSVAMNWSKSPARFAQDTNREVAFISKGKLFVWGEDEQVREIHSPYVQEMIDRMNRHKQVHGWKQNTSLGTSYTGMGVDHAADQVELQMVSAQFMPDNKLLYFMRDSHVGGLFEYDVASGEERRLFHKQYLRYENLTANRDNHKVLCSQHHDTGIADIMLLGGEDEHDRALTEGDTVDTAPAWLPGEDKQVLYQSAGLARDESGYVVAHGPAAIKLLDLDNNKVVTVKEDDQHDYMQPRVDSRGDLYFIRRPYETVTYGHGSMLLDILLFPFRLLRAIFHYLNFFSLMYTRKPLTSADGPAVNADIKDIIIKGKRIDAEKALRKENPVNGIPSLVPGSWQLVRRNRNGNETVLATNVASFDITSDDEIMYSNGYAVFLLSPDRETKVVLREKLIDEVISS